MGYKIAGQEVGDIGFGFIGLTQKWEKLGDDATFAVLKAALDAGSNYWNAGDFYGHGARNSLALIRAYLDRHPEDAARIVLNVKGGVDIAAFAVHGDRAALRANLESTVAQLGGRVRIAEWECARRDPAVPYEETIRAIAECVAEGKVGAVAVSEVSAATIRQAAAVTKISSVEVEISLWQTDPLHNGIAAACAELDIPILAYSPLGRGFLTGKFRKPEDAEGFLKMLPRFSAEHFDANFKLVEEVERLAARKGCTPAQIAIGWVLAQGRKPGMPKIIPIPGASSVERVRENATVIALTDADLAEIDTILESFTPSGDRYHKAGMTMLDTEK